MRDSLELVMLRLLNRSWGGDVRHRYSALTPNERCLVSPEEHSALVARMRELGMIYEPVAVQSSGDPLVPDRGALSSEVRSIDGDGLVRLTRQGGVVCVELQVGANTRQHGVVWEGDQPGARTGGAGRLVVWLRGSVTVDQFASMVSIVDGLPECQYQSGGGSEGPSDGPSDGSDTRSLSGLFSPVSAAPRAPVPTPRAPVPPAADGDLVWSEDGGESGD